MILSRKFKEIFLNSRKHVLLGVNVTHTFVFSYII